MRYILERLREGPTYAGVFVFLSGAAGVTLSKPLMAQLTELGMAVAGALLMALPNKTAPTTPAE